MRKLAPFDEDAIPSAFVTWSSSCGGELGGDVNGGADGACGTNVILMVGDDGVNDNAGGGVNDNAGGGDCCVKGIANCGGGCAHTAVGGGDNGEV